MQTIVAALPMRTGRRRSDTVARPGVTRCLQDSRMLARIKFSVARDNLAGRPGPAIAIWRAAPTQVQIVMWAVEIASVIGVYHQHLTHRPGLAPSVGLQTA